MSIEFFPEFPKIRKGSLVTTYHKGFFIVDDLKYETGVDGSQIPMVYYHRVLLANGSVPKRQFDSSCHASFCNVISETDLDLSYRIELDYINDKYDRLRKFINGSKTD